MAVRHIKTRDELRCAIEDYMTPALFFLWVRTDDLCMGLSPFFADTAITLQKNIRCYAVDVREHGWAISQFGIEKVPTIIYMEKGREVHRETGLTGAGQLLVDIYESYI